VRVNLLADGRQTNDDFAMQKGKQGPAEFPLAPAEQSIEAAALSEERDVFAVHDVPRTVSVGAPKTGDGGGDERSDVPFFVPEGVASGERFEMREELGAGGMGMVHCVFDAVLRRQVAMKVLHHEASHSQEALALFLAEAQLTAQLDHPNIVPVHDLGSGANNELFFTMKLVSGMTLAHVFNKLRYGEPTTDHLLRVLRILLKACDAVEFAHGRGVIHCDLKPENVMLGSYGQVYVMDWGVSVLKSRGDPALERESWVELPSARARKQGSVVGTPGYMAPEQALGLYDEIDERTDVYGLGGILYELLTGKPPNQGKNPMAVLSSAILGSVPPPAESEIWRELPPGLCRIATRALSRDKAERYRSVREMRRDLERFLEGGGWFATRVFQRGDMIVAEGEAADTAYVIESGHCQVFKLIEGRQETVGHLVAGDVFGETAALSTGIRTASVLAKDEVTVRIVTRDSLERELSRNPLLGAFVRALATRFREAKIS
jgi:eukaryotic-like serine/threonine-protein kinase